MKKVKVRWTYTYTKELTFEEVVEVPDDPDGNEWTDDEMRGMAGEAATYVGNSELKPVEVHYPGDPCDAVETTEIVPDETAATIRYSWDEDHQILTPWLAGETEP
jgi:hypothetical protein